MRRGVARTLGIALIAGASGASAAPRTQINAYVGVDQILSTRLSGGDFGDDTVTYTALTAGVDGTIATRRVEAGFAYRYSHQFGWSDDAGDADIHEGLLRATVHVTPFLDLDAGAIATRTRYDIRGAAPNPNVGDPANIAQVYSLYGGPSFAKSLGGLDLTAAYRFGYTKVENKLDRGLETGTPGFGAYNDSTNHLATASVGMRPGELPFGWTVSGAYSRENVDQLDGRFTDKLVRLDLVFPVSPTLALTAGVGYEDITATQDRPLFAAAGVPVVDRNGQYVSDPSQPRLLAYDNDGFYYDVGVIWRPSSRTSLIATVGKRYGGLSINGSFNYRLTSSSAVQVGVYNVVDSFGRSLGRNLGALPTNFVVPRSPFTGAGGGCVFSNDPRAGAGGCFDDSLQSVTSANFRSRGIFALYSAGRGPVRIGLGGGYTQRRYLVPAAFTALYGTKDESWFGQANMGLQLTPRTSWENFLQVDYFRPSGPLAGDVISGSVVTALYHNFTGHWYGTAAAGLYAYDTEAFDTNVTGQLLLGMRYQF